MAGVISVNREQWLGFRWQAHGLDGNSGKDILDDLLVLGFQDSRQNGMEQALGQRASRIGSTGVAKAITPEGPLVSYWSIRGAPHAHRVSHLDFLRDALAPQDTDEGGASFVKAVDDVAEAIREVVRKPLPKGDVSAEVARRVRPALVEWCQRCQAKHVPDPVFRAAVRQAQVVVGPTEQRATILHPAPKHKQDKTDDAPLELVETFFRVNGPTSKTLYRDWVGSGPKTITNLWKEFGDELVRVEVDGQRYDLPEKLVDAVKDAPKPSGVAMVPPNDPYLRQVDRKLLMPDSKRRGEVYKALSGPGALLVDGEVAGTWRYRRSEREIAVTQFDKLSSAERSKAEDRALRIAKATDDPEPRITWD
jgi:hypothetical protein